MKGLAPKQGKEIRLVLWMGGNRFLMRQLECVARLLYRVGTAIVGDWLSAQKAVGEGRPRRHMVSGPVGGEAVCSLRVFGLLAGG